MCTCKKLLKTIIFADVCHDLRGQSARGAGRESKISFCGWCGGTPSNGFRGVENAQEEEEEEPDGGLRSWRHACFRVCFRRSLNI
jgi:hypothetical protein